MRELAVFLNNLLFAKALSCTVSVVKADHVQAGPQREISVSVAINGPFWHIDLLPFCWTVSCEKVILSTSER